MQGKNILFIEPAITDYFTYAPLDQIRGPLAKPKIQSAMAMIGSKCAVCDKKSTHLWMSQNDLDYEAMETLPTGEYYNIPYDPTLWKETLTLCDEHIIAQCRDLIESKRISFLTFSFPDSSSSGCYE